MAENDASHVELKLLGLQVQVPSQSRLMLLREATDEGRVLPVVIDDPEAQAIYRGIEGIEPPRPLTHELIQAIFGELGVDLARVTITEIKDHTFLAEIELKFSSTPYIISARPSDAVALAVRSSAPIFASREVMDEAGQLIEIRSTLEDGAKVGALADGIDPEELLDEFKQFLSDVSADDFEGPAEPGKPEQDHPDA